MSKYSYEKRKSRSEKIGFYTALSVCIVAVCLAIWSAYISVTDYAESSDKIGYKSSLDSISAQADNDVSGVTAGENVPKTQPVTQAATVAATEPSTELSTEQDTTAELTTESSAQEQETRSVLQTVLQVDSSLSYPLKNTIVLNEYSETAVKNKTMGDYRAHTGVDFKGDEGEPVYAMADGTVKEVYNDAMFGTVVEVDAEKYSVYYCGLKDVEVNANQTVKIGDKLGLVSEVPFESEEESHIHVEIKVDGQYIDPLTVINSDE